MSKNAYGIEHLTIYMASYINPFLDCLQSKKYCEAIMDDLLLFNLLKEAHMSKLEDLLRAL